MIHCALIVRRLLIIMPNGIVRLIKNRFGNSGTIIRKMVTKAFVD